MILSCHRREELWIAYDSALRVYLDTVKALPRGTAIRDMTPFERAALQKLSSARAEIRRHCIEHGCDAVLAKLE